MEKMPKFGQEPEERKGNWKPAKEEEKMIERINAQEELEKIIKLSDDSGEKNPWDIIEAAKDYLEKMGGVDEEAAKRLGELIEKAEKEMDRRRVESAREKFKNIKTFSKVRDTK